MVRKYLSDPDVQFRAVEWGFGAVIALLIICALAFGWVGRALDGVSSWYTENLVPTGVVAPEPGFVHQAASGDEGYTPGE